MDWSKLGGWRYGQGNLISKKKLVDIYIIFVINLLNIYF